MIMVLLVVLLLLLMKIDVIWLIANRMWIKNRLKITILMFRYFLRWCKNSTMNDVMFIRMVKMKHARLYLSNSSIMLCCGGGVLWSWLRGVAAAGVVGVILDAVVYVVGVTNGGVVVVWVVIVAVAVFNVVSSCYCRCCLCRCWPYRCWQCFQCYVDVAVVFSICPIMF